MDTPSLNYSEAELANILALPRRIFEEVSEKNGEGKRGEREFPRGEGASIVCRPLTSFGLYGKGQPYETTAGAIQFFEWSYPLVGEKGAAVTLLNKMPKTSSDFDNICRPVQLMKINVGKHLMHDYGPGYGRDFRFSVNMATPFSEGFSVVEHGRYLSVIISMLERLRDLPAEIPFTLRERVSKAV